MDKVSICNAGLTLVGGNTIVSFEGNIQNITKEVTLCRLNYVSCVRYVLADRPWSFAKKRGRISIADPDPAYGDYNKHRIPTDSLTVLTANTAPVIDPNDRSADLWWTPEDGYIISKHGEALYICYTVDVQDTSKFSPSFEQALILYLASKFGLGLGASRTRTDSLLAQYDAIKTRGFTNDSLQGRSQKITSSGLLDGRSAQSYLG